MGNKGVTGVQGYPVFACTPATKVHNPLNPEAGPAHEQLQKQTFFQVRKGGKPCRKSRFMQADVSRTVRPPSTPGQTSRQDPAGNFRTRPAGIDCSHKKLLCNSHKRYKKELTKLKTTEPCSSLNEAEKRHRWKVNSLGNMMRHRFAHFE